jgi:hypothetical protein
VRDPHSEGAFLISFGLDRNRTDPPKVGPRGPCARRKTPTDVGVRLFCETNQTQNRFSQSPSVTAGVEFIEEKRWAPCPAAKARPKGGHGGRLGMQ